MGERCELPQRGPGWSPGNFSTFCVSRCKIQHLINIPEPNLLKLTSRKRDIHERKYVKWEEDDIDTILYNIMALILQIQIFSDKSIKMSSAIIDFFFFLHYPLFREGCGGSRSRVSRHTSRFSITSIISLR